MIRRTALAAALCLLTALGLSEHRAAADGDDGKRYALSFVAQVDQKVTVHQTVTMIAQGRGADLSKKEQRQYVEQVLAVEKGRVTKVERDYKTHTQLRQRGKKSWSSHHVLHGNKIVLELDGKKVTSPTKEIVPPKRGGKGEGGKPRKLTPNDITHENVDNPWRGMMPAEPVAVGAVWKVDPQAVRRALGIARGDFDAGGGKATLSEVTTYRKRRCGLVKVELNGTVKDDLNDLLMRLTLEGTIYVDLDSRQPIEMLIRGRVAAETDDDTQHSSIELRETRTAK